MKIETVNLIKKTDHRGYLIQYQGKPLSYKLKHFFISATKPGKIRGNHFHLKKLEFFLILQGKATITFTDPKTKKAVRIVSSDKKHQLIKVPPNIIHTITNTGKTDLLLLALVSEVFDEKNPDTFSPST